MMINRLATLTRRYLQARKFGVSFKGTRNFHLPSSIHLRGRDVPLRVPDENSVGWDFINLALDDDYGLRKITTPPGTILDVGANCGLFSLLAANYFPKARIHAYEPNPRVFSCAAGNVAPFDVKVHEAGIGFRAGKANMDDYRDSTLAQTTLSPDGAVTIVPLAEAVERLGGHVDFLKLDCEGAEWDIFQAEDAFHKIDLFRMEYHLGTNHSLEELRARTSALGFRLDHLLEHGDYGIAWFSKL